jgi:hypothetical protein
MLSAEEYLYRIWKALGSYDPDTGTGLAMLMPTHTADLLAKIINPAAIVWTPVTGKTIRLMGGNISVSAAGYVVFTDGSAAGNVVWRTPKLLVDTPYNFDMANGVRLGGVNNVLYALGSNTATAITGTLYGRVE